MDQSRGLGTFTLSATSAAFMALTVLAAAVAVATSFPAASRTELATITDWSIEVSFWTETVTFTVALVVEICDAVTRVPV